MGSPQGLDPRLTKNHTRQQQLANQARSYRKADPPPHKVKPVPVQLLAHCCAALQPTVLGQVMADLLIVAFFYLLRPGEYTYDKKNNHPFRLCDVTYQTPTGFFNAATVPLSQLDHATMSVLNLTTQKNLRKNQPLTAGDTDDALLSPLKATRRLVKRLRQHSAPPNAPLHTAYLPDGSTKAVTARMLTQALRSSCKVLGPSLGISGRDISNRALRNGGCMALIRSGVDSSIARLLGRWESWAMLECLQRASVDTSGYARLMLQHGHFTIPAHQHLPSDVAALVKTHLGVT